MGTEKGMTQSHKLKCKAWTTPGKKETMQKLEYLHESAGKQPPTNSHPQPGKGKASHLL